MTQMDPTTSPRDHMSSMGLSSEGEPEKATRQGRGAAIPHYIIAYKMVPDFIPRDESGCYLTSDCPEMVESPLKSHLWDVCLKALHKHAAGSLYKGQEVKSYPEFSRAIHSRLLQMNRQIRNHMMPGDLKVPFTKRNATALATYKSGELYKLWQQQKLPNFIVSLAADTKQDGTEGQPAGMLSGLPLLPLQDSAPPGPVSSLPGVTNPLLSQTLDVSRAAGPQAVPISTKEVMALLSWGKNGNRPNSSDQSATTEATQPKEGQQSSDVEAQALRLRVSALEQELRVTKEELAIQQSKLRLEMQHTLLLKRKYEGPCPD